MEKELKNSKELQNEMIKEIAKISKKTTIILWVILISVISGLTFLLFKYNTIPPIVIGP